MCIRVRSIALAFIGGASLAVPALRAEDVKKEPDWNKAFARRDGNGDGKLTLIEFKSGLKDKALETADARFKKLDTDGDGSLTLEEFKTRPQPPVKKDPAGKK